MGRRRTATRTATRWPRRLIVLTRMGWRGRLEAAWAPSPGGRQQYVASVATPIDPPSMSGSDIVGGASTESANPAVGARDPVTPIDSSAKVTPSAGAEGP